MKLLLDTHAFLWFVEGNSSLSTAARQAIEDETHRKFVSPVSTWEVAIKVSLNKLTIAVPFEDLFPGEIAANGFDVLDPTWEDYRGLLSLPWHHRDPFDRLLIAQALLNGLTVVTSDSMFAAYGVPTLW